VSRVRASILTVARHAGVSRQTVSNAICHPERVRADTLAHVLEAIRELRYVPHEAATRLRHVGRPLLGVTFGVDNSPTGTIDTALAALVTQAAADHHVDVVALAPRSTPGTNPTTADAIVVPHSDSSAPARRWNVSRFRPFTPEPQGEGALQRTVGVDENEVLALAIDYALARSPGRLVIVSSPTLSDSPENRSLSMPTAPWRARPSLQHITVDTAQRSSFETIIAAEATAIVCLDDFAAATCVVEAVRAGKPGCLVIGVGATDLSRQLRFPSIDLGLEGLARTILEIVVGEAAEDGPDVSSRPFVSTPDTLSSAR
jgi:DNA-binding LacI/PurR family transcriptional regulator